MNESFTQLLATHPFQGLAVLLLAFVVYLLLGLLPICGILYVIYFLLTLPLRRNERARVFLDLLELGLREGRSPESAVTSAAASHDRSLGVRFHLLAAHIEGGLRLGQALETVPRLVPAQVRAMLAAGERIGDLRKVLPACRLLLRDSVSSVRGAMNYLILLAVAVTPAMLIAPIVIKVYVLPKYIEVFAGMLEGQQLPAFTRLVLGTNDIATTIQFGIAGIIWLATLLYIGGPRLRHWMNRVFPGVQDARRAARRRGARGGSRHAGGQIHG
jgi:type II secretory pathway component PulF